MTNKILFFLQYFIKMGYNSKCNDQNCSQGCCNTYGDCPQTQYSSSSLSKCKYYYTDSKPLDGGSIAGVVVGPIIGLIIIIIVIVCCCKRCRQQAMRNAQNQAAANINLKKNKNQNPTNITTQQLTTQYIDPTQILHQNPQQAYGQPYAQPYAQSYGQPYVQPPMQQPVYGSPEQALFGPPAVPGYPVVPNPTYYGPNPIMR